MLKQGTRPSVLDKRDFAFHRSFGLLPSALTPLEFNYDVGKTMPDQNADGYPFGCTGYTQAEIATDEDNTIYKPSFTYEKTCYMEGHGTDQGCDVRTSAKAGQIYGVQALHETTDVEAASHRRGSYFNVDNVPAYDSFDDFRSALRIGKRPISIGTIWFQEWATAPGGILTSQFTFNGHPEQYAWHNYKICGEKVISGEPYLVAKTWQGAGYGDRGWCYFSRETFNKAFDMPGTIGIIQPPFQPRDTLPIKLTIIQYILIFMYRLLGKQLLA